MNTALEHVYLHVNRISRSCLHENRVEVFEFKQRRRQRKLGKSFGTCVSSVVTVLVAQIDASRWITRELEARGKVYTSPSCASECKRHELISFLRSHIPYIHSTSRDRVFEIGST